MSVSEGAPPSDGRATRRRVSGDERRQMILVAARRAFSRRGDVTGTTVREIAKESGVSEAALYRHFESKEDLFYQAAVQPLRDAISAGVARMRSTTKELDSRNRHQIATAYYQEMISMLADLVPLLGLVLFGEPGYAETFYQDVITPAVDEMREAWNDTYRGLTGEDFPVPELALANFGIALIFALDQRRASDPPPIADVARALADMESRRTWAGLRRVTDEPSDAVTPKAKAKWPLRRN